MRGENVCLFPFVLGIIFFSFFFVARAKHWMYVGGIPFVYSQSLDGKYVLSAIVNRQKKNNAFHMVSQKVFPIPERVSGHLALTHPAFMRTLL